MLKSIESILFFLETIINHVRLLVVTRAEVHVSNANSYPRSMKGIFLRDLPRVLNANDAIRRHGIPFTYTHASDQLAFPCRPFGLSSVVYGIEGLMIAV